MGIRLAIDRFFDILRHEGVGYYRPCFTLGNVIYNEQGGEDLGKDQQQFIAQKGGINGHRSGPVAPTKGTRDPHLSRCRRM